MTTLCGFGGEDQRGPGDRRSRRAHPDGRRRDAGATLVEYSLGVAVLVVGSLLAISWLSSQAGREAEAQSDCISSRPPPASCLKTPVPAPPTSPPPATGPTTTVATPPSTDPAPTTTTTTAPSASASGGAATTVTVPGGWTVSAPITVLGEGDAPVEAAEVTARVVIGRQPLLVGCTTDASGTCSIDVGPLPPDLAGVRLVVLGVESDPRVTGPLPSWDLPRP